jgi:hypothetical protein
MLKPGDRIVHPSIALETRQEVLDQRQKGEVNPGHAV